MSLLKRNQSVFLKRRSIILHGGALILFYRCVKCGSVRQYGATTNPNPTDEPRVSLSCNEDCAGYRVATPHLFLCAERLELRADCTRGEAIDARCQELTTRLAIHSRVAQVLR